ncbi:MAG: hypothetical protein GY719_36590 [bacterium]|nr:hypothetical protein [bacterium]
MSRDDVETTTLSMAGDRPNPFPGLRPFEPEEDHLFFGREKQIDELLAKLRSSRFLAVLGTSGSGKSSLVKSGLIPALYSGFMARAGSSWRVAMMRPGEDPVSNLASSLAAPGILGEEDDDLGDIRRELLLANLRSSSTGLVRGVREARVPEGDNILVLVDQFEELFRFKKGRRERSGDEAASFVKLLQEASLEEELPIYVVLTMRSDFIGNCVGFPQLPEFINDGLYLVPRMTRDERRRAITGPVAVGGGTIAPRLVTQLLNDVGDDPDQLPILQHALMRTWDYWSVTCAGDEPIDLREYEGIGTMKEAMSRHADDAFEELGDSHLQAVAERMFKALTMKDEDSRGIRRPCRVGELCAVAGAEPDEVVRVIDIFRRPGRAFLMPPAGVMLTDDSIIDISHESLMRVWKRLIAWVEEEAEGAQFYMRLSRAAARHEEGEGGLWRQEELQLARPWREKTRPTPTWGDRYDQHFDRSIAFLDGSERVHQEYLERKEAARVRELKRTRKMAAIYGYAALVTLALGLLAWWFTNELRKQAVVEKIEVERELVVVEQEKEQVETKLEKANEELQEIKETGVSAAELLEAERQRRLAEEDRLRAEEELRRALEAADRAAAARAEAAAAAARAEALLAETEALRNVATEAERRRKLAAARALAFESQGVEQPELGALLAVQAHRLHQGLDGEANLDIWNALNQSLERTRPGRAGVLLAFQSAVRAVAVAPDGGVLASGSDDGLLRLVDPSRADAGAVSEWKLDGRIRSLAFAPGENILAAGASDGTIRLLDRRRPAAAPRSLAGTGGSVNALAFQPGGARLAAGGADGSVRLWDLEAPADPVELRGAQPVPAGNQLPARILSVAWSPDGEQLAAASAGEGAMLWRVDGPASEPRRPVGYPETRSVAFSRRYLAVGLLDGRIVLHEVSREGGKTVTLQFGHTTDVSALSFHPRLDLLASAGYDGSVRLWDLRHLGTEPIALPDQEFAVWSLSFSPDGDRLAIGSGDRTLRIWRTRADLLADELCAEVGRDLSHEEWMEYLPGDVPYQETCPGR